jgi:hypothetical protein
MNKINSITQIYKLSSKHLSSTFQAHPDLDNIKVNDGIPKAFKLILGNYESINFPVVFKQAYGNKLHDILNTGWAGLYLISDKLLNILEINKLTGWKIYPINLFNKKKTELFGYHGLSITGRSGPVYCKKESIFEKRYVPTGPLSETYKGYFIDLSSWNQNDFFLPKEYYGTFISENAATVLMNQNVTNISIENISNIEIPKFGIINIEVR